MNGWWPSRRPDVMKASRALPLRTPAIHCTVTSRRKDSLLRKAVALFSGGLDSTALLYHLRFEDIEPIALSVNYGQRHSVELDHARETCILGGFDHRVVFAGEAFTPLFEGAPSSQVGSLHPVPHGHYAAENMKTTIVPNRNMLLIAMAGALAESVGASLVAYAAHAGDHTIYPDCRLDFYESAGETLFKATDGRVRLYAPFGEITKTDIVRRAFSMRAERALANSWSCYDPQDPNEKFAGNAEARLIHCGLCGTCVERREAFRDAGVTDPTEYAA